MFLYSIIAPWQSTIIEVPQPKTPLPPSLFYKAVWRFQDHAEMNFTPRFPGAKSRDGSANRTQATPIH
ncbi:hypothetical protein I7I50_07003 [Histoplasma capsulatum G186AR]|uniref:Uncharacterized protein n=1 Tax=Ajellomyces capsulatus TaxID=5037 RepID=A0A8H7YYR4_AJECA|nr:hypothetical protein I7I52_09923 [Histoplasma capsulatum]QSS67814.1 hypothetical protein I7I50_07003 [Histoplasma capsulatum G186AR]